MHIPLFAIVIEDRIRENVQGSDDEWREFVQSFVKWGQLQAITVEKREDGNYRLIAGERRIRAIKQLNEQGIEIPELPGGMIEASFTKPTPLRTKLLKEFAENNERKDFTWPERAKFIRKFHEQMSLETDGKWTQELTASMLNISQASISNYLQLEDEIKKDASIAKASTLDAAVKRMKTQRKLQARHEDAKTDADAFAQSEEILRHGDARELIKELGDESVDCINFDPPWGEDASHKAAHAHEEFDDSTEYADALMHELFPHVFRVLKPDRFCVFWFRSHASEQMAARAIEYGFNLLHTRTPCIWYKSDKITDRNMAPDKQLVEAYETFYLLRKGDPVFHEKRDNNVFDFPRVILGAITHPTEKPVPLLAAILRLVTVPGEMVFDPTAGSSAMLDAALRNNRKTLGYELSERYYKHGITRIAEYLKTVKTI